MPGEGRTAEHARRDGCPPARRERVRPHSRVAEAIDAYLEDRLAEPGPLRAALATRRSAGVVLGSIGLGALATALAPAGVTVVCWIWGAITAIDVAWLLTTRRR